MQLCRVCVYTLNLSDVKTRNKEILSTNTLWYINKIQYHKTWLDFLKEKVESECLNRMPEEHVKARSERYLINYFNVVRSIYSFYLKEYHSLGGICLFLCMRSL